MTKVLLLAIMLGATAPNLGAAPVTKVVMRADGFTIQVSGKPIEVVRFKAARAQAVAAATRLYGKPTAQRSQCDCATNDGSFSLAGFNGGLELTFDHGKFSGWTVNNGGPNGLQTVAGIGVGSTVAQVRKAYPNVFVDPGDEANGGLGPSFQVNDGPNGFLDGNRATSRVTAMYAGATCIVG